MTWRELVARSTDRLDRHEAWVLVAEVAGVSLPGLVLCYDEAAPPCAEARVEELVRRRLGSEPIQHLLGHWSFRELELVVDRRALIPRPETEMTVGYALAELACFEARAPRLLDLGTGSGAIACCLVHEVQHACVLGLDVDLAALSLARENRAWLEPSGARRLVLLASDFYGALSQSARFDLIVSNPPYVSQREWEGLDAEVRDFDPPGALIGGNSGLEAIERVITGAPSHLNSPGSLVIEIAPHQAEAVAELALRSGAQHAVVKSDLTGKDRVLVARYGHADHN